MSLLHAVDPWAGFDPSQHPEDLQGWHGDHPLLSRLVVEEQPQLVVEVGSWKGQSSTHLGRALRDLGPADGAPRQLLCVDTWLGALEFWRDQDDPERYRSLDLHHGYPRVYYQFLANIAHAELQDTVIPFPQTSITAARWLIERGVSPDLVYIDASHEENDVYADLTYFWHAARSGAVLFGDDYQTQFWPGVVNAVDAFAEERGVDVEVVDEMFWILRKPI